MGRNLGSGSVRAVGVQALLVMTGQSLAQSSQWHSSGTDLPWEPGLAGSRDPQTLLWWLRWCWSHAELRARGHVPRSVVSPAGWGCACTFCTPSLTPQRAEPQREAQEGAEDSCATPEHTRLTKQC